MGNSLFDKNNISYQNNQHVQNSKECNNEQCYKLGQKPNSFKKFEENLKKNEKNIINNKQIYNEKMNNKMNNKKKIENSKPINNDYFDYDNFDYNGNNELTNKNNNTIHIVSKSDTLIENEIDEFEIFRMEILSDKSIDKDMKQILIQSRKEQIDKFESKTKNNIENALRSGIVSILIVRLKNGNYFNLSIETKKYLINQIDKWIDGKIQVIKLDSDILFELYVLIDTIKITRPDIDDVRIKKIFEPKNLDDYMCFIEIIEKIKIQSIGEEQERINKKIEKEKLEEELKRIKEEEEKKKKIEIKTRQNLLEVLIFNLNKLSLIDNGTLNLKTNLEIHINKFIGLETNYIELKQDLYEKIQKFINSIRIAKENKQILLNLIKIVE